MKFQLNALVVSLSLMCVPAGFAAEAAAPAIIPLPQKMESHEGAFTFRPHGFFFHGPTRIFADSPMQQTGQYLASQLARSTSYGLSAHTTTGTNLVKDAILLTTSGANPDLGPEGYDLVVQPQGVVIRATDRAGAFYGVQSLLQLFPPEVFASHLVSNVQWVVPCVHIEDQPRFKWRGLMLDVSRHFFTKTEVEQILDAMALHKLNSFHWHLVDDQGWRVEIKKYPRLTEVGGWRKEIGFKLDPKASTAYGPDGRYGGFYTQDDIREVVAYAQARHINIVPEIEMPGHSTAALMAYPEFSCTGGPFTTDLPGGIFNGIYCAGNERTFAFVEDVIAEICELFPGRYIHVGGDEVLPDNWKACPKCQARMREEGLHKEAELESYFIRRIEKCVNSHGRNLIGWSEIREGGLAQNAAIMDWVGGATEAATAGHDVVMSPLADCYFDHYQSANHATEPHAIGGFLPLNQVYAFEPMPANLDPKYQSHILGAQANEWTEYMPSIKHVEYMAFPRLCALSEVLWSARGSRRWSDFTRRLPIDCRRLEALGVNYRRDAGDPNPSLSAK